MGCSQPLVDLSDFNFVQQHDGPHEGDEGWCKGHDQRSFAEDNCRRAWLEDKGVLTGDQQHRGHCHKGGEDDGRVHNSRLVSYQDRGEASQEDCEGLPDGRIEETDLEQKSAVALCAFSEVSLPWESHEAGLRGALSRHGNLRLYLDAKLRWQKK